MVLRCTICGNRDAVKPENVERSSGAVHVKSLLKLLSTKLEDFSEESFQKISNSDCVELFCIFCNDRNEEIHNLLSCIESLRASIEKDFASSFEGKENDRLSSEPECAFEETVKLASANLRQLILHHFNLTPKWTTTSTQTDENDNIDNEPLKCERLRPRLKAKVEQAVESIPQQENDEDSCSSFQPLEDHIETDSDFRVEKNNVRKRKCRKSVKAKKQGKEKNLKNSIDFPKRSGTRASLKLQNEGSILDKADDRLRCRYNNLIKDVVVQLEKLPTKYLSTRSHVTRTAKIKQSSIVADEDPKIRLSCRYEGCKRTFTNEDERVAHSKKKHEGITHPFSCPECPRSFRQQKLCLTHVKSHLGELPFVCEVCGKGFVNRGALKSHAVRHTTETPFKCDLCSKSYKGHGGLVYHKRKAHTGDHPYVCEVCGVAFVKSDKLKRHMASVHATDKPIICEICGKTFSIKNYLYMHMRIHQGNPFVNKNRKKSVIKSVDLMSNHQVVDHQTSNHLDVVNTAHLQLQQEKITVDTLNSNLSTLEPPLAVSSSSQEEEEDFPQISTISHSGQQRQIILTLDTKSNNISHHRIQTENPSTNSTFVINFNKKALSTNTSNKFANSRTNFSNDRLSVTYNSSDSAGQVIHEPQNLLLTTGGREGNVIITNSVNSDSQSPGPGPSSLHHRMETFHFPPLTAIQSSQQGVIQYFPLSSIPELPSGFEFFANQNSTNT